MRFGRLLPALSAMLAVGALIVLTGSSAAATQPGRLVAPSGAANLSTPAGLDAYLRSIGVKRASLVTQRGARNYAGPNCPGKGWSCTTSTRVLQVTKAGGVNRVDCPPGSIVSTSPEQSCVVVQTGDKNTASCNQSSNLAEALQHCSITQTGRRNVAEVEQNVDTNKSGAQTATQRAYVTQTSTGSDNLNRSNIYQSVLQTSESNKLAALQTQDTHQIATVVQSASGSGNNMSHVRQNERMKADNAQTQNQNTAGLGNLGDCASGVPYEPNACANVYQAAVGGNNDSDLKQTISEDAWSSAVANQQQGSWSSGIESVVHQQTVGGSSFNVANQSKKQKLNGAPGSWQAQYDPMRCCGISSQDGGSGNSESISQTSTQEATGDAYQQLLLLGESRSPNGSCSIGQFASNSSSSAENGASASPCTYLTLTTSCTSGDQEEEGEGFCNAQDPIRVPPGCEFECYYDDGFHLRATVKND